MPNKWNHFREFKKIRYQSKTRSFIQNIGHIGRGRPHEKTTLLRVVSGVFWELRSQCIEKQSNYLSSRFSGCTYLLSW